MTQEDLIFELKKRCSFWLNNKTISKKHALECLLGILESEESKPSLPSDLDTAAEKYSENILANNEDLQDAIEDAFKAGAEWMAGQGQTFEAHVDNGCAIASGVKLPFVLWDTYEDGDVLKVQIKKKQ